MKYALKFTPSEGMDTTMWLWFQNHGAYYVNDRDGVVHEAEPGFIDSNLTPDFSEAVERVSFDDVPEHVHGYDPREILEELPHNYNDDE